MNKSNNKNKRKLENSDPSSSEEEIVRQEVILKTSVKGKENLLRERLSRSKTRKSEKMDSSSEKEGKNPNVKDEYPFLKQRIFGFLFAVALGVLVYLAATRNTLDSLYSLELEQLRDQIISDLNLTLPSIIDSNDEPAFVLLKQENRSSIVKHPVFIIPGITSSNLESWGREGCQSSYFRKKIWGELSMVSSLLLDKQFWLETLALDYETGLDNQNARVRAVQGIDAATYFIPGYWVFAKMVENLAILGYDTNTIHLASYDWRLSLKNMEIRDGYFSKLKSNVELFFGLSKKTKVVFVPHSMGNLVMHYFLNWVEYQTPGWTDKYVHAIFEIAPTLLGVPKTISSILSGEMRDTAQLGWASSNVVDRLLTKDERVKLFRSWGGVSNMLPKGGESIWGNRTFAPDLPEGRAQSGGVILTMKSKNQSVIEYYTASHVLKVLTKNTGDYFRKRLDKEFSTGIKMESLLNPTTRKELNTEKYWSNPLEFQLPNAPNLKIITVYGIGKPTERSYYYTCPENATTITNSEDEVVLKIDPGVGCWSLDLGISYPDINLISGVQETEGDGAVPLISMGFMTAYGWRHNTKRNYGKFYNPYNVSIVTREYAHDPVPIVQDPRGGARTGDHVDILGNHKLLLDLLRVVTGIDQDQIVDLFVSNVRDIAEKVELKEFTPSY